MDNHTPVLVEEVLTYLAPRPGQVMVDATFGYGGHAAALMERLRPGGTLVALDRDPTARDRASVLGLDVVALTGNFSHLSSLVRHVLPHSPIHGVLLDCGISSAQLSDPALGLSFTISGPLNMRLDRTNGMTAADIINTWPERDLVDIFQRYGEEPAARRIARTIIDHRRSAPITETTQLAHIISGGQRHGRLHPATRIFQALRIAVNEEIENLSTALRSALDLVTVGGRVAIISFHSLEDRVVKHEFRQAARRCHCDSAALQCTCDRVVHYRLLTKHPVRPNRSEVLKNPRSRSAKLRVIERLV